MKRFATTDCVTGRCHTGSSLVLRLAPSSPKRRSPSRAQSLAGARTTNEVADATGITTQEFAATFSHTVPFKSANVPPTVIKPPTPTPAPTDLPASIELPKSLGNTPQVVYAPGKEAKAVAASLQALLQRQRKAMAVKVDGAMAKAVTELLPDVQYNETAMVLTAFAADPTGLYKVPRLPGSVSVVASSASDLPQVEECRVLAEYLGCYAFKLCNLDITDMDKLLQSAEAIKAADVVIVVSSGDSALPAAVASVVDAPIVAVPSSQGKAPATGLAPSEAFMASCIPGVTVVSPDNGFAAASTAARMLRMASRLHHKRTMAEAAAATKQ